MTRARMPRPHEVAAARRDPRLLRAVEQHGQDRTWRARGVCRTVDPEVFFPAPSEPADKAVALCQTCDVQGACLAWALEVGDCHGVWGATTPRERRAMLVAWRTSQEPEAAPMLRPTLAEPVRSRRAAINEPVTPRCAAISEPAVRRRAAVEPAPRRRAVLGLATPA